MYYITICHVVCLNSHIPVHSLLLSLPRRPLSLKISPKLYSCHFLLSLYSFIICLISVTVKYTPYFICNIACIWLFFMPLLYADIISYFDTCILCSTWYLLILYSISSVYKSIPNESFIPCCICCMLYPLTNKLNGMLFCILLPFSLTFITVPNEFNLFVMLVIFEPIFHCHLPILFFNQYIKSSIFLIYFTLYCQYLPNFPYFYHFSLSPKLPEFSSTSEPHQIRSSMYPHIFQQCIPQKITNVFSFQRHFFLFLSIDEQSFSHV